MSKKISHDSETPAEKQQVITACAFIHHNFDGTEKLFMPKRAETKKFLPGVYELPGGHINFGEELITGLKREIKEEFGLEVRIGDPFYAFTYNNELKGSHSVEIIYFASFISPLDQIVINPEDHSEYKWISENEIGGINTDNKPAEDQEIQAIIKGFVLLKGNGNDFA